MAHPQPDTSRLGHFRDRLAHRICEFALNHIATPWYAGMISGSIRLGMVSAAVESTERERLNLDPTPWYNDFGDAFPIRDPNINYSNLAFLPGEEYNQNIEDYL